MLERRRSDQLKQRGWEEESSGQLQQLHLSLSLTHFLSLSVSCSVSLQIRSIYNTHAHPRPCKGGKYLPLPPLPPPFLASSEPVNIAFLAAGGAGPACHHYGAHLPQSGPGQCCASSAASDEYVLLGRYVPVGSFLVSTKESPFSSSHSRHETLLFRAGSYPFSENPHSRDLSMNWTKSGVAHPYHPPHDNGSMAADRWMADD